MPKRKPPKQPEYVRAAKQLLQNAQCYEALLEGLSPSNDERITESTGNEGYGIIAMISKTKAVLMRPVATIPELQAQDWATPGEYIADFRHLYDIVTPSPEARIDMLSISEHAVYPCHGSRSSSEAKVRVEKTHLQWQVRFTRSYYSTVGKLVEAKTECGACAKSLKAENYVHCRRCDKVFHAECTKAEHDQPFIMDNGMLYDSLEKTVMCPACQDQAILSEKLPPDEYCDLFLCIDIGSHQPKVSARWRSTAEDKLEFESLQGLPVSAVTITDGLVQTHLSSASIRRTHDHCDDTVCILRPIKKILYNNEDAKKVTDSGRQLSEVFQPFFEEIFDNLYKAHKPALVKWAMPATRDSSRVRLTPAIALPSGLPMKRKEPALTALFEAAKKFVQKFKVKDADIRISEMPESEMALLGSIHENKLDLTDHRWVAIFDAGGSTCDFSLHRICSDRTDYNYDLYASQSCIHGRTQEIQCLIDTFPDLNDTDWDALEEYVKIARTDPENAAKMYPKIMRLGATWERHRDQSRRQLRGWLKEICTQMTAFTKDEPVAILQTGGGLLETENLETFKETLRENLFHGQITENAFTNASTSVVLKGLQAHVSSLHSKMDRSPVSVLFQSDVSLDPGSEDCAYIILTNKGDPLGAQGLIHRSQVQQGEVVAWDVSWVEDGSFDVPYYTILGEVKDTIEHKGLLATSLIPKDEARVIAQVTLSRPSNWMDTELFAASWTNPRGRTIRTKLYRIPKKQTEVLDVYRSSDHVLQKAAIEVFEQVNGLDTHLIDRYTSMKKLIVQVNEASSGMN